MDAIILDLNYTDQDHQRLLCHTEDGSILRYLYQRVWDKERQDRVNKNANKAEARQA